MVVDSVVPDAFVAVVDDCLADYKLVEAELSKPGIGGLYYTTKWYPDFYPALEAMEKKTPDLVMLDLSMPGMVGTTPVSEFVKRFPFVPVVVYSGFGDPNFALQALRDGAHDFIVKGVGDKDLRFILRQVLTRWHSFQERFIKMDIKQAMS